MASITAPVMERLAWRQRLGAARSGIIRTARKVRGWRLTYALPGLAGAAMISAGIGLREIGRASCRERV